MAEEKEKGSRENRKNSYYQPKTDRSQSVLLNRIERYNQHLNYQDFGRKYLMNPAEKMLKMPSQQIVQAAINEKDEEAAEVSKVFGNAKIAGSILGTQMDKARIRKVYQDTVSLERYLNAEKIFIQDPFTEAGSIFHDVKGFSVIDPEKVTYGDLKMFNYRLKHPDASVEKLLSIRRKANNEYGNGGKIDYRKLGQHNRRKKQIDRLAGLSEIHAFMEYSRRIEAENPQLFTSAQKNILYREGGFLEAKNPAKFMANTALIRQLLKTSSFAGEFSLLDPDGLMNERDIHRLLKGQIPGLKLEKVEKGKKLDRISGYFKLSHTACSEKNSRILLDAEKYHLLHGGLEAILWNQENYRRIMKMHKSLVKRERVKGWVFQEVKQELMEDEEFAAMSGYVDHALPLAITGVKTAVSAEKTVEKAAEKMVVKSGTVLGNGVISGLYMTGNDVAAEAVRVMGEGIVGTGRVVNDQIRDIIHLPGQAVRNAEKQALSLAVSGARYAGRQIVAWEKALASTKAGKVITQSHFFQEMKMVGKTMRYGIRKTGRIVRASTDMLFLSSGIMIDSVKQGIIQPAAIAIGLIVFLQIILAAVFGGMGGASVVTITVFDTPEHFNNPNYAIPEEMGFQQRYEQAQAKFQAQIDGIINGYAKTLNKKGKQIPYGVNGANHSEGNRNDDYVSGVTMQFDAEKSNNLEDILSCVAVVMQQQQANHHAEALELLDCFYQSSHTYDYTESPLYSCTLGCETTKYFCNEAEEGYVSTEMKFGPYLCEELLVPGKHQACEVDQENPEIKSADYTGCVVTGTCFHHAGDEEDNFGRRKPQKSKCSNPEVYWNCKHSCSNAECTHDCSRSTLGCGGYWYCGGHDHFGCPDGHEAKTCFGHVNIKMNIHMKTMEELFALGGIEAEENGAGMENLDESNEVNAEDSIKPKDTFDE